MVQQKEKPIFATKKWLGKNRKPTPMQSYCVVTVLCLLAVFLALFVSHGELLHRYFFYDVTDTGMDFFHSIEYVRGRMPYGLFDTLYPPLANLFFYGLYLLVPKSVTEKWEDSFQASVRMKGTEQDLRLQQSTMMLYILFIVLIVLGIVAMTERLAHCDRRECRLLSFCAVFSYGVLCGLERGNILLLCWSLMAFFLAYRNAKNPILREFAYIALAIAAGFKLYPAFLGVLLLRDRNYMAALRTVIYGIVCICFPLFFFNEGLFGLTLWFRVLFDFGTSSGYPWIGNGFANIVAEAGHFVDKLFGTNFGYGNYALLGVLVSAVLLVCAMIMDQEWKQLISLTLAMLMFQSQHDYVFCLFLIPLLVFFSQEKELRKDNILPYSMLVLLVVPLPLFRRNELKPSFTVHNTLCHVIMLVLILWCVMEAVRTALLHRAVRKSAYTPSRVQCIGTMSLAVSVLIVGICGQKVWDRTHNWGFDYSYNSALGPDGSLERTAQDENGNDVEVQWSGRGAYVVIYNHAPFAQKMTIQFNTGYEMDLGKTHTMSISEKTIDLTGVQEKEKLVNTEKIKIEQIGQSVSYTLEASPGQTQVEISYDGPMAIYDESTRKNGTFSVANLSVIATEKAE